jgi:hypothetical protein
MRQCAPANLTKDGFTSGIRPTATVIRMSDKNFVDVEVQGPRNPTLVRAFCRKCGKYQSVTLSGLPGRESVSCMTCGILERVSELSADR